MITLDVSPNSATMTLVDNVQAFTSKLSGYSQYRALPGSRWAVSLGWFNRSNAEGRRLAAQINSLNGPIGIMRVKIPEKNQGTATGFGSVQGGGQTGTQLVTDGWAANQIGLFKTGDWIECNQQVFQVAEDANSDGSGKANIRITPAIRRSPADNQSVIAENPHLHLRRVAGSEFNSELSPSIAGPLYAFGLNGVEID